MTPVEDREALEVGLVGYEGMVGTSPVLGVDLSPIRALVLASGSALRMDAVGFFNALRQCPRLQRELSRYTFAMLAMARQIVACNCFHVADARLARWLLMTSDRALSQQIYLTQQMLADMLAVRRVTVTHAAGRLQRRKLIRYERGAIRILNRKSLEVVACRCYARIEAPDLNT